MIHTVKGFGIVNKAEIDVFLVWQPIPVLLPGESQEQGSLVGFSLWGRTESDTTEAAWQQQQQQYFIVEKAMAPHSSTLAWKIPWTEEPGGLQSMGSLRVGHD